MPGTPVSQFFAPGVVEKCFDINHGRQKEYQVGGPLFIVRVTEPTGIAGSGMVFPYQSISQPPGYPLKGESGDLWQVGYTGSFIHTGLPDLVQIPNKNISGPTDYRSNLNPNDLSSLGARAYSRLRPKVAVAGLGQAVAEARDVPATLRTTAAGFSQAWKAVGGNAKGIWQAPRGAANQFVNFQFGWKPFVNDVQQMYDLVARYETHLDKAERLNDKWLKRRFAEEEIQSSTVIYNDTRPKSNPLFRTYLAPAVAANVTDSVNLKVTRQSGTKIWYEGSFKYYRPEFDKRLPMHENVRAGRGFLTLAGANINPVLIYKVTPWTWLVDWYTNVGDNIQVAQDMVDNSVVSRYMYLMRESFDRYEYVSTHTGPYGTIVATSYQEVRVKRRVSCESPFGFALQPGGLSGVQYAILAALGLSRLAP
jgi:hypothetical protein